MLGAVAPRKVPQEEVPHRKPFYDRLKRGIHPFTVRGGNSFTFRVTNSEFDKWFDLEPEEKYLNCIFPRSKKDYKF